ELRSQASNLESLGSKPSVLPITPLRNGGWGESRTHCLWSFTPALFQMSFPTVIEDRRSIIERRSSIFYPRAHFKAAGRTRTCVDEFRKLGSHPLGHGS